MVSVRTSILEDLDAYPRTSRRSRATPSTAKSLYESMFGNTRQVAEAIAAGVSEHADVEVTDVVLAPALVPPDVDLVVLGGPTHVFSMSRDSTRHDAVRRGAAEQDLKTGIRDWITGLPPAGNIPRFAAFDTKVRVPLLPGSAARPATEIARRLGFRVTEPESFLVEGYAGPLRDGELDRATAWGRQLRTSIPPTSST